MKALDVVEQTSNTAPGCPEAWQAISVMLESCVAASSPTPCDLLD